MICLKSNAILKAEVRDKLLTQSLPLICGFFIIRLVSIILSSFEDVVLPEPVRISSGAWVLVAGYLFLVVVQLVNGVLMVGEARMYMNYMTGREVHAYDVFSAFRSQALVGVMITLVLILIVTGLCLPGYIFLYYFGISDEPAALVLGIILLGGGLCVSVRMMLIYSQCYYLAVDFPDYSWANILQLSKRAMEGQLMRLLKLCLSFIPMILACIVSMGIGLIWVYPYMRGTFCNFYLDLMEYHAGRVNAN